MILTPVLLLGCARTATVQTPPVLPPLPTNSDAHYQTFPSSDALAEHFGAKSDAGIIISAHRGGPQPGYPENCLETFEKTLTYGPIMIECDIRMTRDGYLVLMHDETLDRTTTGRGRVGDETFAEIRKLRLRDNDGKRTEYIVPTLNEALAWSENRAILSLDIKPEVPFAKVVEALEKHNAHNRVQAITYSTPALKTLASLDRRVNHSASADTMAEVNDLLRSNVDLRRVTVFTGVGQIRTDVIQALRARGIRCAMGTFGDIDRRAQTDWRSAYQPLVSAGIGIIATDAPWLAVRVRS